ncbi:hypothetical protein SAMN05216210_1415 [Halopseudomonas salegens]|uniref:Uncharacterized protein n=1 Tax=Halopseudomonas salegens TaxID=1434072 RepID=A0A1H2FAN6_9GAMM|nr:hypothetical protein SAMN05216210_1415 [Halopseudomonas salegens]
MQFMLMRKADQQTEQVPAFADNPDTGEQQ